MDDNKVMTADEMMFAIEMIGQVQQDETDETISNANIACPSVLLYIRLQLEKFTFIFGCSCD